MQSNWLKRAGFLSLGTSLVAIASTAAIAQEGDWALEEIMVTAQKREQSAQDVPLSVGTLKGEKLDVLKSGGEDIRFLSARVPSLIIESSFGRTFPRFYIRGLGNTDFDLNASQPVSLVYDEVVLESPMLKGFPVFDVERVEVLRGPQGTLFGRNTPAGIVKFDSVKPSQEASGYVRASYGRFNTTQLEAAYGGPLGDVVSFRASALWQYREDYIDNTNTPDTGDKLGGYDERAGRFQLLIEPDEDLSVLLNAHARDLQGTARIFIANAIVPGTNDIAPGVSWDEVAFDGQNYQNLESVGFSARIDKGIGSSHTLTSITAYETLDTYSRGDIDGGVGCIFCGFGNVPFDAQSADGIPTLNQFTQELRIASEFDGNFNYQTGLFFFNEKQTIESFNYNSLASGDPLNGYAFQRQKAESWAAFFAFDYTFNEHTTLAGGVRYTEDEKTFSAQRTLSPVGAGATGVLTASPSDEVVSWDLSLTRAVNDDVNVYGRVAKSFRAPSVQGRLLFGDVVTVADTETILSWEVGVKADVMDGRGRVNATLFFYDMNDQQLTAVGGGTNFNRLINAADTDAGGFEIDAEFMVTENLLTTFGFSYNRAEINDPALGVQPCGAPLSPCTVLDPAMGAGIVSIDGNQLPNAPKVIMNWTARYSVPVGDSAEFFAYTDWAYRSQINFFLYESEEYTGRALLEGGLKFGYAQTDGSWEVATFARNITGTKRVIGGIDFNNLTGMLNEPRTYGVEATFRF